MKRFIEILILALFVIYFVGDVFYSRVIERNWKIKQGEYPEKAEINFRGSFSELSEFMPGKSNELLRNAYSLMGITSLSEYNKIIVGDWDKAFFFSSLALFFGDHNFFKCTTDGVVLFMVLFFGFINLLI